MPDISPAFALSALLLGIGIGADLLFGPTMRRRRALHLALFLVAVVFLLTLPSCSQGGGREDPELPYGF